MENAYQERTSNSNIKNPTVSQNATKEDQNKTLSNSGSKSTKKGKASIGHKFKNWATNLNFKLDNYVQSIELDIPLVFLGKEYKNNMRELLDQHIRETIWFSYREKMPAIMAETFRKKAITCDRGWGCMIRCGQMMLAEGIKRHFAYQGKLTEEVKQESLLTIISFFADFVKEEIIAPFSIQQICRIAHEMFGSKPGEWYRASSVMMGLDSLNEKYGQRRIKGFRLCIFKEGTIYQDQIMEKACQSELGDSLQKSQGLDSKNEKDIKFDSENGNRDNQPDHKKQNSEVNNKPFEVEEEKQQFNSDTAPTKNNKWTNAILLFVATKTGLSEHNVLYLPTILRLLKFPQSIGILGGKDTKGYYFLGSQGSTLLYLDPHYVQESCQNFGELEEKFGSHFRKKFFQVGIDSIDTSIGFGFYIANENDYVNFRNNINKAIQSDPNFLIGFQDVTPTVNVKEGDIIEIDGLEDNMFEVIT